MENSKSKRFILLILDGWGLVDDPNISAIAKANTSYFDGLMERYPSNTLVTHGLEVGLPEGQMGNSEVGHMNLGAGRVVYQELARINKAVEDGSLFENPGLKAALADAQHGNGRIHLMGLLSEGGVHSHENHLLSLIDYFKKNNLPEVYIHAFTDGRDVGPKSSLNSFKKLLSNIRHSNVHLQSIIGRYYAMDRDNRWDRISKAYHAMVNGVGTHINIESLDTAILAQYERKVTDEFLEPMVIINSDGLDGRIKNGDTVLFYNFRTDRPRQITKALKRIDFPEENMKALDLNFYSMTRYDESFTDVKVLFDKEILRNTMGEVLSSAGKSQLRIAETEKYPHVTFFFSGGEEEMLSGEKRIMVPSPKVATYDLQPSMSAYEINQKAIQSIQQEHPDFICLNFANTDMVGHTGVFDAAVKAAETVDKCLEELIPAALAEGYEIFIIADHGNADIMIKSDGSPHTAHTMSPVPIIFVSDDPGKYVVHAGKLGDIAPTILKRMSISIPLEMDGENLIETC